MPIDIKALMKELEAGVVTLAKKNVKDYADQAVADGKDYLNVIKSDLKTWTKELADGDITKEDLKDLLLGDKDLLAMNALTQAGLALAKVEKFKTSLVNLVVTTAVKMV